MPRWGQRKPKAKKKADGALIGVVQAEESSEAVMGVSFAPQQAEGEEYALGSVGGHVASVYAVVRTDDGYALERRQRYRDEDETECFYACCWTSALKREGEGDETPLLVFGGLHGVAKVVDCGHGAEVVTNALSGHGNSINDVQAHPREPALVFTASKDESVRLWNVVTARCVAIFAGDRGHRDEVLSVDVHPEGRIFCSSGVDNSIKIWRVDGENLRDVLSSMNDDVFPAKDDDDVKRRRLSSSSSSTAKDDAKDLAEKTSSSSSAGQRRERRRQAIFEQFPLFSTTDVHCNYVDCAKFVSNLVVSKSTANEITLWAPDPDRDRRLSSHANKPGGGVVIVRKFALPTAFLWFLRFGVDSSQTLLAAGNNLGRVFVWRTLDSATPVAKLHHPRNPRTAVRQVAFSPDSNVLAFGCDDASVVVYDISHLHRTTPEDTPAESAAATSTAAEESDDNDAGQASREQPESIAPSSLLFPS